MERHVRRVDERITEYSAAIGRLLKLCETGRKSEDSQIAALAKKLTLPADDIGLKSLRWIWIVCQFSRPEQANDKRAKDLAGEIGALIGKPGAAAKVAKLVEQVRGLGRDQDQTLAEARMILRRMKQTCRTLKPRGEKAAGFAAKLRAEIEKMLRQKQPDG